VFFSIVALVSSASALFLFSTFVLLDGDVWHELSTVFATIIIMKWVKIFL
jgi:hypothetical protein